MHKIGADGYVPVLRTDVESVLGAPMSRERTPPDVQPNWAALENEVQEIAITPFGKKK